MGTECRGSKIFPGILYPSKSVGHDGVIELRFDKTIYLISSTESENDVGDVIVEPIERKIFATKNSIRQSEFYQAAMTSLRPELSFTTWASQYKGESELKYNSTTYRIIRTFEKDNKTIELVCQGLVNS